MRFIPFCTFLACLALAACNPPPPQDTQVSFTQYKPIALSVADIKIVDEYKSAPGAPELYYKISPEEAMHIWVKDRLRAVGGERTLQVIIKDAGVKKTQEADRIRYDTRLDVEMRVYGQGLISEANLEIHSNRTDTLPASMGATGRKQAEERSVKQLMDAANAELEKNIYQYFSAYVTYE